MPSRNGRDISPRSDGSTRHDSSKLEIPELDLLHQFQDEQKALPGKPEIPRGPRARQGSLEERIQMKRKWDDTQEEEKGKREWISSEERERIEKLKQLEEVKRNMDKNEDLNRMKIGKLKLKLDRKKEFERREKRRKRFGDSKEISVIKNEKQEEEREQTPLEERERGEERKQSGEHEPTSLQEQERGEERKQSGEHEPTSLQEQIEKQIQEWQKGFKEEEEQMRKREQEHMKELKKSQKRRLVDSAMKLRGLSGIPWNSMTEKQQEEVIDISVKVHSDVSRMEQTVSKQENVRGTEQP